MNAELETLIELETLKLSNVLTENLDLFQVKTDESYVTIKCDFLNSFITPILEERYGYMPFSRTFTSDMMLISSLILSFNNIEDMWLCRNNLLLSKRSEGTPVKIKERGWIFQ